MLAAVLLVVTFGQQFQQPHLMRRKIIVRLLRGLKLAEQRDYLTRHFERHGRAAIHSLAEVLQQATGLREAGCRCACT